MNIPYTVILTKSDKLNKTEYNERILLINSELQGYIDNVRVIPFSAKSGEGTEEIRSIIEEFNV